MLDSARKKLLISLVCASGLFYRGALLWATSARADDFQDRYDQAVAAYKRGSYTEAITHFQRAYGLRPLPRLLINIGQAHLRLGHPEQALAFLRLYLQTDTAAPPALRKEVEQAIAQAEAQARLRAENEAKLRVERERTAAIEQQLTEEKKVLERKMGDLERSLSKAENESEREKVRKQIEAERRASEARTKAIREKKGSDDPLRDLPGLK